MAVELSFLVLKAVAMFQDAPNAARSQAVCKNWCWGMRERVACLTNDSICSGGAEALRKALVSGSCSPDTFVLDITGRPENDVSSKEKEALAAFLQELRRNKWFRKLSLVQQRTKAGCTAAGYILKSGYSTSWHMEHAAPLVEASLLALPAKLQVLHLQLECLPGPSALAAIASCSTLQSLHLDCQQGTLTASDSELLQLLALSLRCLALTLPELQDPAVESLVASLTSLTSLKLERTNPSVCAWALAGVTALKHLAELRLAGYGLAAMNGLKALTALTALQLSHAVTASQEDWQALGSLAALQELHLLPAATAMVGRQVSCAVPLLLPYLTSLKMLVSNKPAALLAGTPQLHTLHVALPHVHNGSSALLIPLADLPALRSLTLSGSHLTLNEDMLRVLCNTAQRVTQLLFLGRVGSLGPGGLTRLGASLTGLKHLALGARHVEQMFVVDVERELPRSLEVLELSSACLLQPDLGIDTGMVPALPLTRAAYPHSLQLPGKRSIQLHNMTARVHFPKAKLPPASPTRGPATALTELSHVDKVSAQAGIRQPADQLAQAAQCTTNGTHAFSAHWPNLHTLRLHKCCGIPPCSSSPDSTMRQPVILNLLTAPFLFQVDLTDCTLSDSSLHGLLAGGTVSSLSMAPYENWRGTAAQLTPGGMQAALWGPAGASLQQLELRLTHRMHRDGTDAALVTTLLPGMVQLRGLRLFTEESHWHRLPKVKALGRLRRLQQLHLGAVHEKRVDGLVAVLKQVLPKHCRLTVVKYSPDLMKEE